MIIRTLSVATAAVLLAGCGSGDAHPGAARPTSTSTPAASLKDTCPLVEQALPKGYLPSSRKLNEFSDRLAELSAQGDAETQNAIGVLARPTKAYIKVADGLKAFAADRAWLAGIDAFAKRCKAAGSSALQ